MIYVPTEVMRPYLQHYTADLQDRAPLQAQRAIQFWLDREFSYDRLPQLALDLVAVASHVSQANVEQLKGSMKEPNILIYFFFPPITQSCSVSDVLFTGGRGVSDFSVLKYY